MVVLKYGYILSKINEKAKLTSCDEAAASDWFGNSSVKTRTSVSHPVWSSNPSEQEHCRAESCSDYLPGMVYKSLNSGLSSSPWMWYDRSDMVYQTSLEDEEPQPDGGLATPFGEGA